MKRFFRNLRRGRTFQAEGIVRAKAQKWETMEHIQETAIMTLKQENEAPGKKSSRQARGRLGTDSGEAVTLAKKLSLQPACYSALLQNQNVYISWNGPRLPSSTLDTLSPHWDF